MTDYPEDPWLIGVAVAWHAIIFVWVGLYLLWKLAGKGR